MQKVSCRRNGKKLEEEKEEEKEEEVEWKDRSDIITIGDAIKEIANILQFFIPGFIGIQVFKFCASKTVSDQYQIVLSCALSYITNAFLEVINGLSSEPTIVSSIYGRVVISTVALLVCGIVASIIIRTNVFEGVCSYLFGVSPKTDLFDGILDVKDGANVKIFLKGKRISVYGHYAGRDDDCSDPWIAISEPIVYTVGEQEQAFAKDVNFLVRISDIDYMVVE